MRHNNCLTIKLSLTGRCPWPGINRRMHLFLWQTYQ